MQNIKLIIILLIGVCSLSLNAQNYTISGQLSDATNGEDLIGATVVVLELSGTGTVSNEYGFYSLSLPTGNYTIKFQFIGFEPIEKTVELNQNINLNIELGESQSTLNEVVIKAEKENGNVTATEMSVTRVTPKDLEKIPVLFGEKDVIKSLQLTPGIKAAGEGSAGFYVRGGGIDQNLILLDGVPVYNAAHLGGLFSIFNSSAIKAPPKTIPAIILQLAIPVAIKIPAPAKIKGLEVSPIEPGIAPHHICDSLYTLVTFSQPP